MVTIRRAVYEDIPDIMQFMDEHWKKGNILATNREFFEWQFVDDGKVNMFLGVDEENGRIYGIMGAIVYNKSPRPDISGCTWQTIKSENPVLGIDLVKHMYAQLKPRYACSAGLTKKAMRIYELQGMVPTAMDHYYRLADKSDYVIAKVGEKIIPAAEQTGYSLQRIHSVEEMKGIISEGELAGQILSKDYGYIGKRYFGHPVYQYDIWKILDAQKNSRSVLITREEKVEREKICKIIDYYGNPDDFRYITNALDSLMEKRGYEFVDIYSYGIPTDLYEQAGFCRCDETCMNIIPNYFHPFVRENITLRMIDPVIPGLRLFRGDGDQDRPC